MKKILVTGSNGLLGNALQRLLGSYHVYHTRKDCDLLNSTDTLNYVKDQVVNHGVDTIIHCAAKVGGVNANIKKNKQFFTENYYINNNVLKSAFECNVKNFVNVLSTCIFPYENITYPLTAAQIDNGAPHPSNAGYAYAKRLSGYETKIFREITGNNWFSVVPTNLYGPNDNFNLEESHMIPGMIHRAYLAKKNNTPFEIWGDGSPLRQFMFVNDLAELIILYINEWNRGEHCMMVDTKEYSVMQIAEIVRNKFNINKDKLIFNTTKPAGQYRKPAKSDVIYNFKPLEDGISETIDWFIKNYETIRK